MLREGNGTLMLRRTGLTIPLQITLSEIKLSGFIILVFSKQKGLTLVFRNDPLESLKVSSTFDSIPFVRDYLQKEIEGQLRILLMDELPAIIHRLSLRLWVPEYHARDERETGQAGSIPQDEPVIDPFASPPQDPVDPHGHKLSPSEIASLSIETGIETKSLFSQKNLLRLATLTDSNRTLSLFTPSIQDVVYRAWAGPTERGEVGGLRSPAITPALSRSHSYSGCTSATYNLDSTSLGRPTLHSFASHSYGLPVGASRHAKGQGARQRKKRIVNLRKRKEGGDAESISEDGSIYADSASVTESARSAPSIFSAPLSLAHRLRGEYAEPSTVPRSPDLTIRQGKRNEVRSAGRNGTPPTNGETQQPPASLAGVFDASTAKSETYEIANLAGKEYARGSGLEQQMDLDGTPRASMTLPEKPPAAPVHPQPRVSSANKEKVDEVGASSVFHNTPLPDLLHFINDPANGGTIVEQAWLMKMAGEIARRYQEERKRGNRGVDAELPPAYVG